MSTKKFAQMSTKKLTALLETASEEDAQAINAILESRNAVHTDDVASDLSEEEKQAIAAAETANSDANEAEPETEAKPKKEKKPSGRKPSVKLSAEELEALSEEAKANVGHRCTVVLPGTATRVDGTILTTLKDKRAMQVYYQVETDACDEMESRKVYKKVRSEEITVLDEVVELKKKTNSKARKIKEKIDAGEWEAEAEAIREAASANIGKTVDMGEGRVGHIVSLLNDKRSNGMYYRIEFLDENGIKKYSHKVINYTKDENGAIVLAEFPGMAEELDEEGLKISQAYQERKAAGPRKMLTPEEKVLACEEAVKKAEATLQKAQETLEMRKNALEIAKKVLENKFDAQAEAAGAGAGEEELA
jgi:hypothetical protein